MKWVQGTIIVTVAVSLAVGMSWAVRTDGSIGFLPPTISVRLLPGESGSYELKVHNGAGRDAMVRLTVNVTQFPAGGSREHIVLSFPEMVLARRGNTFVPVEIRVESAALPGLYVLSNWLVR